MSPYYPKQCLLKADFSVERLRLILDLNIEFEKSKYYPYIYYLIDLNSPFTICFSTPTLQEPKKASFILVSS